jgi:glutamyl-tRNA synthetase
MAERMRVRFAPSPTGYLHVGGARTALFNWLLARKHGGTLILRIEDTDIERSSEEMVKGIVEGLNFLGIDFDEGPLFQSSFLDAHLAAARRLVEEGKAYYDFTPREATDDRTVKERILDRTRANAESDRRQNPYRDMPLDEARARIEAGERAAIRLKVPEHGKSSFEDMVFGIQERDYAEIEDLVLVRSGGHPLYNLSVVVDDAEMGITDVIRGQDHLTNTHKQILIYQALGAQVPRFGHLPLINAPGKEKLSKRKHGEVVSITTYKERGFIPDALVNFLALLGWSPGHDTEIMTRAELISRFSLEGVNKSAAIFNFNETDQRDWTDPKALWMNGEYIRMMELEQLAPMVAEFLKKGGLWRNEYETTLREWFYHSIDVLRARYRTLVDFAELGRPYFSDDYTVDPAAVKKNLAKEGLKELLDGLADRLNELPGFTHESVESAMRQFAEEKEVKAGLLINAARTALTGQSVGPGMFEVFLLMGRDRSVARLRKAGEIGAR